MTKKEVQEKENSIGNTETMNINNIYYNRVFRNGIRT